MQLQLIFFETNAISEEIKNDIEEAWNAKVKENQMQITAELREEFASKYEHDKANMVEAVEKMLDEKLNEEISEFAEDRKKLAEARAKYHVAMRENADLLKGFVMEQLGKEVSELHEDQKSRHVSKNSIVLVCLGCLRALAANRLAFFFSVFSP